MSSEAFLASSRTLTDSRGRKANAASYSLFPALYGCTFAPRVIESAASRLVRSPGGSPNLFAALRNLTRRLCTLAKAGEDWKKLPQVVEFNIRGALIQIPGADRTVRGDGGSGRLVSLDCM